MQTHSAKAKYHPDNRPVRVFVCPCGGNNIMMAGQPKDNPTLKERREIGELITMGCTIMNITIKEFRKIDFTFCDKH